MLFELSPEEVKDIEKAVTFSNMLVGIQYGEMVDRNATASEMGTLVNDEHPFLLRLISILRKISPPETPT